MSIYSTYSQLVKPNKIERDISSDCKVGKFAIYPIQRGFGVTFGNTLRRVMLSSIRGSAIASIRVDGIDHEFSFIPGICQDMVAICLNLRRVVIKSDLESADAKLEVVGPCVVTAGMIDVPEGVSIINKDHVLFEIDTDV